MVAYLIECEICGEQYTGSTKIKFRSRANKMKYKRTQKKVFEQRGSSKASLKAKCFHKHYCSDRHNDIEDWVITLIDSADTLKEFRRKEMYWMYKLKSYAMYDFNERDVYEAF